MALLVDKRFDENRKNSFSLERKHTMRGFVLNPTSSSLGSILFHSSSFLKNFTYVLQRY